MAAAFPGTVFWIDPFPQHFEHGDWMTQNDSSPSARCFPMDPSRHAHQFGRVEVVRGVVRGLRSRKEAVRLVPVYGAQLRRGEKLGARRGSAKHFCACGVARSSR